MPIDWGSLVGQRERRQQMQQALAEAEQKKQEAQEKRIANLQDWFIKQKLTAQLKKESEGDKPITAKELLGIISGVSKPESKFSKRDIQQVSPLSVGRSGGGQVLTPPGATFRTPPGEGGQIFGPGGRRMGEFAPGSEPRRETGAFPSILGNRFGVSREEAGRKYLGLGQAKEEISSAQKKAIGRIQSSLTLIKEGSAEDIDQITMSHFIASIQKAGLDPRNPIFRDVLEEAKRVLEEAASNQ